MTRTGSTAAATTPIRALAVATATTLLLVGCGSDDAEPGVSPAATESVSSPEPTEAAVEGVQVDVTIADGEASPQGERVEVGVGEPVTITVTSDAVDEIHVHSDPDVTIDVEAGGSAQETFTIDTPGQVAVESHELGVTIVQLVVRP